MTRVSLMFLEKELPERMDPEPIGLAGSLFEYRRKQKILPGLGIGYSLSEEPPYEQRPMMIT